MTKYDRDFGRRSRGVTLLEVLIAVFVLSFGVLGLLALQINALQSAAYSYQSSLANLAAKSVKEAMWNSLLSIQVAQEDGEEVDYVACLSLRGEDGDGRMDAINEIITDWRFKLPGKTPEDPGLHIELKHAVEVDDELILCSYKAVVVWYNNRFGDLLGDDGGESNWLPDGFPDGPYAKYEYFFRLPGRDFEG